MGLRTARQPDPRGSPAAKYPPSTRDPRGLQLGGVRPPGDPATWGPPRLRAQGADIAQLSVSRTWAVLVSSIPRAGGVCPDTSRQLLSQMLSPAARCRLRAPQRCWLCHSPCPCPERCPGAVSPAQLSSQPQHDGCACCTHPAPSSCCRNGHVATVRVGKGVYLCTVTVYYVQSQPAWIRAPSTLLSPPLCCPRGDTHLPGSCKSWASDGARLSPGAAAVGAEPPAERADLLRCPVGKRESVRKAPMPGQGCRAGLDVGQQH